MCATGIIASQCNLGLLSCSNTIRAPLYIQYNYCYRSSETLKTDYSLFAPECIATTVYVATYIYENPIRAYGVRSYNIFSARNQHCSVAIYSEEIHDKHVTIEKESLKRASLTTYVNIQCMLHINACIREAYPTSHIY